MSTERLDENGLRQCLRIAGGASLGFLISQLMGWNYGVFFTVFPMFLLGMMPVLNAHLVLQFLGNAVLNVVEVALVVGLTRHLPVATTLIVFGLFYTRFRLMARGPLFVFGANGVLMLSVMLHFASYPEVALSDLTASLLMASLLSVIIAALMHQLFPDVAPRRPPPPVVKSAARRRHETLMGASVATLCFVVFQVMDLRDSLSAQMATVLILFALHLEGARVSAYRRALGALLGCSLALGMQLLLFARGDHLALVVMLYWVGLMLFAREHLREGGGSGVGFGALTTLGILFGNSLSPTQDMVFSALYRLASMSVALVVTLLVMALLHRLLNAWAPTRLDA